MKAQLDNIDHKLQIPILLFLVLSLMEVPETRTLLVSRVSEIVHCSENPVSIVAALVEQVIY